MGVNREVYEFAAGAGAFEGYVYGKDKMEPDSLNNWINRLVKQYNALPSEVRDELQDLCDGTVGRAVRSIMPFLGEDHDLIIQIKSIIKGELPSSPDDFSRKR